MSHMSASNELHRSSHKNVTKSTNLKLLLIANATVNTFHIATRIVRTAYGGCMPAVSCIHPCHW